MNCIRHNFIVYIYPVFINKRVFRFILMLAFFMVANMSSKALARNVAYMNRLTNLNTVIDVQLTEEVETQISNLVDKYRSQSEIILGRTSLYFPAIEDILRRNDLPDEFKYITVVESSLLPNVVSHQGAAGLWQFMKGTADLLGLKVNKYVDERRDLIKSTEKATQYLKVLYDIYGDWTMALAAYNCGQGNVDKAIRKSGGSTNYWEIQKYLPSETKKYIPRFIAASYLMNYYYLHDLTPAAPSEYLLYNSSVKVFKRIDLKKVSSEFEIDPYIVELLNPTFVKDIIPASEDDEYVLTLPEKHIYEYIDKYNSYDNLVYNPLINFKYPEITELPIAESGSQADHTLAVLNPLKKKSRLSTKRDNLNSGSFANLFKYRKSVSLDGSKFYKLKRKESLKDVALAHQIPLESLLAANQVSATSGIAPGSIILLP